MKNILFLFFLTGGILFAQQPQSFSGLSNQNQINAQQECIKETDIQKKIKASALSQIGPHLKSALKKSIKGINYKNSLYFPATCFAPDTDPRFLEEFYRTRSSYENSLGFLDPNSRYNLANRWSSTAINGGGLGQGDITTLTWSYVADGTPIGNGGCGLPDIGGNSDFISFFNGIYGAPSIAGDYTTAPWHQIFLDMFNSWSVASGLIFVYEPNDDGAVVVTGGSGQFGLRGDVRISGHPIDGNSGVLACNYYPQNGDMIIDTADNYFSNNPGTGTTNVLTHEIGHGVGLQHVCPVNQTKLMEPFVNTAFIGPQEDDILATNRHYGDVEGENGTPGTSSLLGSNANPTSYEVLQRSIDDVSDIDYYSFNINETSELTATLTPTGTTYLEGVQLGNGSCSAGTNFNAQTISDIKMEVLDTNGSTILATGDINGAGIPETISSLSLIASSTYYVRISQQGAVVNDVQMYDLELSLTSGNCFINDGNIQAAVDLWISDPTTAEATYGNISNWDTSCVSDMSELFKDHTTFNDDISLWDTNNVTDMSEVFQGADSFNQPIGDWDVSNVTNMDGIFKAADSFNQPIGNWDVSSVTDMNQMFRNANAFNQPIGNWDVTSVTDMGNMFLQAVNFNQDISNWDVSTVINLVGMFNQATQFNQNLSNWEFNSFNYDDFISNSGLDINNYDALLEAFVNQNLVNENLNAQNLVYCDNNAREELINNMGWIITGDNYGTECDTLSVCELSVASNGFENGLFNNGAPFWVAQQVVLDGSFTVTNFELNLFHDPGATIDDVLVLYYADEGGQPGEILFQENLTPVSQTVVGANFGLDVSKVTLAPTVGELAAGTYWLGTLGTSSIGGTTAWEVSTVAEGENALNTEDGITWGLNSGEGVAVYSLFGQCETENPFDTENPVAICQNINVLLDENGQAIIDGNLLDGGSTDNEGIVSFELDVDTFTCTDIGENTVILTVSDSAGNQATCEAIVTLEDAIFPEWDNTLIGGGVIVTIDDLFSQDIRGFANVFETNGTTFVFGESWGVPDLQTIVDPANNILTLQPNYNTWGDGTDPFWVDQETLLGNKLFEGNTYVEDNTLVGSELTFTGTVTTNTLDVAGQLLFNVNNGPLQDTYQAVPAQFGGIFTPEGVTADVVLVTDEGADPDENDACEPVTNAGALEGKIAILRRGLCEFGTKALNAENAGAVAVIVVNNFEGAPIVMAPGAVGELVTIPVLMVSDVVGEAIIAELANGVNTTMVLSTYTTVAFIKVFNSDFSVLKQESIALGEDGSSFSVTYNNVESDDAVVQYGFQVLGLNANPINEAALGSIILENGDVPTPNLIVECDGSGNTDDLAAWLSSFTGTDNCSDPIFTNDSIGISNDCGTTGFETVTFTLTDASGNVINTQATFTIEDTTAPSIDTVASNSNVECDGTGNTSELNTWLSANGGAVASDLCAGVTWTNDFTTLSDDCGNTGSTLVTFTATDACGLFSSTSAIFTIEDTTAPSIDTAANNSTVECDGTGNISELNTWLSANGGAVASEECSELTWSNDFTTLSDDCGNTGSTLVTFTATDACGLFSTTSATFTIEDTTSPSIDTAANNSTVECDGTGNISELNTWLASNGGAVASEECSELTWSNDFTTLSDDCGNTGSTLVTFTATDACGLFSTTSATFTIEDTTSPSIDTVANNSTVECDGTGNISELNTWLASNGGAVASEECSELTWSNDFTTLSDDCGNTGSTLVTFTATDACGLFSTTSATFTIEDTTAPLIECPSNITIVCDSIVNFEDAIATEECGSVVVSQTGGLVSGSQFPIGESVIEFTAEDQCGNFSTCVFTIEVIDDDELPEAVCQNITVLLDSSGNASISVENINNGSNDNCGVDTLEIDMDTFDCSNVGNNTVILTVTDINGNENSCSAIVTVYDFLEPQIVCPADEVVNLDPDGTYTLGDYIGDGIATVTDNCSDPLTIFTQDPVAGTLLGFGIQVITFEAEDENGNVSTCSFELNVEGILGANDNQDFASLVLYPNPANSNVYLSNPRQMDLIDVTLYDLTGRILTKINLSNMGSEISIDVSTLANAPYLLVIKGNQGNSTKTLIVNN